MRTFMLAVAVVLSSLPPVVALAEEAPIPKEGSYVSTSVGSATLKSLPLGKEWVQLTWDWLGVQTNEGGKGLTHNASLHCVGGLRAHNQEWESYVNSCVITRPDGDQIYWVETGSGRMGSASKGTGTIVGGTGKLAGITGGGEWTRYMVRPAADGTFQSVNTGKVTYKLP
jgi:hypothetical protein